MSPEERQAAIDEVSAEDLAKLHQAKSKTVEVEIEDLILCEFALKFGWEAYKDVRDDLIKGKEMMTLLSASRKLDSLDLLRSSQAAFIGSVSAQSKKPSQTFTTATKNIVRDIGVNE